MTPTHHHHRTMTLGRALSIGLFLSVLVTAGVLVAGFVSGSSTEIPGVLEMSSTMQDGKPSTQYFVNPLAPVALAVVLGVVLHGAARLRSSRDD